MNTRMNLTGLADLANAQLAAKGMPLQIGLADIVPDPNNPRLVDDGKAPWAIEAQDELDADVATRGVKTPISVRAHPSVSGKYIINYGHRRYLAAFRNGLPTIPAFVDEKFDSYDQVNENELRIGLTARARALFIKSRLDAGESKVEITERLRKKNQAFVTEHLALIDAPDCVNRAYANGVTSARTLYDLRQAWEEFPAQIGAWCSGGAQITRETIRQMLAGLRHDEASSTGASAAQAEGRKLRHDNSFVAGAAGQTQDAGRLRRDGEKLGRGVVTRKAQVMSAPGHADDGIVVEYRGRVASVSASVLVPIVVDGQDEPLVVRLSELVFRS
jgi:ParB/RepB/Spo0J family partition protein